MSKVCKKCSRPLPDTYKHKCCENCRNAQVKTFKTLSGTLASLAILVVGTGVTIITKGKINIKK